MIAAAESTTSGSISHFSTFRPAVGQQNTLRFVEAIENRDSAKEAKASLPERDTGVLAEREGFEPSIELLDPITV
jgi:hypothetical protein